MAQPKPDFIETAHAIRGALTSLRLAAEIGRDHATPGEKRLIKHIEVAIDRILKALVDHYQPPPPHPRQVALQLRGRVRR